MIFGNVGVLFNLLSIMAFSGFIIILVFSAIIKLKADFFRQYTVLSRRRLLWLVAISPWFVSLLAATLVLMSGTQYSPFPKGYDLLHWHHAQEFFVTSWHGFSLMFVLSYISFILIKKVYRLVKNHARIQLLQTLAERDNEGFYQLDTNTATAFTAGYLKPRCYITSALRKQLSDVEYQIVQLHEKAHAKRSDPLKKWYFQLLTAFFPNSISRKLNQSMSLIMEQCADTAVTHFISDKSLIATTLLKVRRLAVQPFKPILDTSAVCHYAIDNIEARISYILSDQKLKAFPFFGVFLVSITMSFFCALSADVFHHFIEHTLIH